MPEIVGVDFDLAEVHGADGAMGNGNFVRLAGAIVGDGDGFAEAALSASSSIRRWK